MTAISTPPSPFKIIVPKTLFGAVANPIINLSGFGANHLKLRFGIGSTSAITGGTQANFIPRTAGFADLSLHITRYTGVGVPALTNIDGISGGFIPLNNIPGTDVSINELAVFDFEYIDCLSIGNKTVLGKGVYMPPDAVNRSTWDIYCQVSNAATLNGFNINNLGGNLTANSWYEVFQLD